MLVPRKPREMERIVLAAGWIFKSQEGSHRHYVHPDRPGNEKVSKTGEVAETF